MIRLLGRWLAAVLLTSLVWYAALGAVVWKVMDRSRMAYKTMDMLQTAPVFLVKLAQGEAASDVVKIRDGITYYKNLRVVAPKMAKIDAALAFCYAELGEYGLAQRYYAQALQEDPSLWALRYNAAVIAFSLGHYAQAAAYLEEIVRIPAETLGTPQNFVVPASLVSPDGYQVRNLFVRMYTMLARCYETQKRYDDMLAVSKQAIVLFPTESVFYGLVGIAAQHQGDHTQALPYLMAALRFHPDDAAVYERLAVSMDQVGQKQQAADIRQAALPLKTAAAKVVVAGKPGARDLFYYPPYVTMMVDNRPVLHL